MTDRCIEFVLMNPAGTIVRIWPRQRAVAPGGGPLGEVHVFEEPWGRDSTGSPDRVLSLSAAQEDQAFLALIKDNMTPHDFDRCITLIKSDA